MKPIERGFGYDLDFPMLYYTEDRKNIYRTVQLTDFHSNVLFPLQTILFYFILQLYKVIMASTHVSLRHTVSNANKGFELKVGQNGLVVIKDFGIFQS